MRSAPAGYRAILAALVVAAIATSFASPSLGAARIEGRIDALTVEASDATLAEVLSALSARFAVRIRAPQLTDQRVDGSFHGPLQWVLARLLAGHNYIARYSDGAVEIAVLGVAGSPANAAAIERPPPAAGPARPGRRTRNEAVSAAARAAPRTTGAAADAANGQPAE